MKLTAETLIESSRETVWRFSQTPELHTRWDLRFTDIEYLPRASADEPQRFRYATRIGFQRVDESAAGIRLSAAIPIVRRRLLRGARVALFLFAFMGTTAYAASFGAAMITDAARAWGVRLAIAAGLSWPVFGLALLRAGGPGEIWAWVDVCLRTMARGMVILSIATAINLVLAAAGMRAGGTGFFAAHLGLLFTSDVTMATYFVREATRFGLSPRIALALWVGVLNGMFGLSLVLL